LKTLVTLFSKNVWFFAPFLLWIITGAILQIFFTHSALFLAINSRHTAWLDVLMTGLTYIGDGVTFAIMLLVILALRKYRLFFNAGCILLLVTLVIQGAKHYFNALRPTRYFEDPSIIHTVKWVTTHGGCSFPSGHTSTAFAMFCFLALITRNKTMGAVYIMLGLIAAWSRIYLAQHFFIDVYVGSIVGTGSSVLLYMIFDKRKADPRPEMVPEPAMGLS
jgi:membrane-associated phospholipid phosphatase